MSGRDGRRWSGQSAVAHAALLAAMVLSGGCALFLDKPSVRIADVRITSVGLMGATARVALDVANPNRFDLTSEEIRYRLSFQDAAAWQVLAEGATEEKHRVQARDSARIELSLPFRYADVGRAVGSLLREGELRYRFEGDVKFDVPGPNLRIPFDSRGTLIP